MNKEDRKMFRHNYLTNNLFDDFFDDLGMFERRLPAVAAPQAGVMKTDIVENKDAYELHVDLPGFKKEDVKAELKDGYLTISAVAKYEKNEDEGKKFLRRERFYGTCSRSFYVGENLTQEDIKARFEDGILKLTVPKKEAQPEINTPKYIAIE